MPNSTSMKYFKANGLSAAGNNSGTSTLALVNSAPPPKPWTKRASVSVSRSTDAAQPAAPSMNNARAALR